MECTWNEQFRILALLGHFAQLGDKKPKEWAILVLGGKAPIRSSRDVEITDILPISGSAFSCQIGAHYFNAVVNTISLWRFYFLVCYFRYGKWSWRECEIKCQSFGA